MRSLVPAGCCWPTLRRRTEAKNGAALPNHIYMDAMGFGMGASCLQITFQAWNLDEARRVYDALVPVGPIMVGTLSLLCCCDFKRAHSSPSLLRRLRGEATSPMSTAGGTSLQAASMIALLRSEVFG